jgi:hypothetical protein
MLFLNKIALFTFLISFLFFRQISSINFCFKSKITAKTYSNKKKETNRTNQYFDCVNEIFSNKKFINYNLKY